MERLKPPTFWMTSKVKKYLEMCFKNLNALYDEVERLAVHCENLEKRLKELEAGRITST